MTHLFFYCEFDAAVHLLCSDAPVLYSEVMQLFSYFAVTHLFGGESVRFSQSRYQLQLSEDAEPGHLIQLQATSPDTGECTHK